MDFEKYQKVVFPYYQMVPAGLKLDNVVVGETDYKMIPAKYILMLPFYISLRLLKTYL